MKTKPFRPPRVAVTAGDPAGIGPEVTAKAIAELPPSLAARLTVIGDRTAAAAFQRFAPRARGFTLIASSDLKPSAIKPGKPGAASGKAAALALEAAAKLIDSGECGALVTAPVFKSALHEAGFPYPGHTGWLEAVTGNKAVMLFAAGPLRVATLTMHLPLAKVPQAVDFGLLLETLAIIDHDLRARFNVRTPRLAVAGLNPHAGEGGLLGEEENEVILPAIEAARQWGITVTGPHPADTLFTPAARKTFDAALCMYHDQAMLPIKTIAMHRAVHLSLGLPFPRTSPAHGAAPDIAGRGIADPRSMIEAIKLAIRLGA